MDKKEYLHIKFKKDFLRYCLLQEDSLSASEIANKLYKTIDFSNLIQSARIKIEGLLTKYLSFDKMKIEGKLSNELSDELEFGLHNKIIAEFQKELNDCEVPKSSSEMLHTLLHNIEKLAWSNGITKMNAAISSFLDMLNDAVKSYTQGLSSAIDEAELMNRYCAAKENTLLERLKGDNIDDIIAYRNALREYVEVACRNILYEYIKNSIDAIRTDETFKQLLENFKNIQEYALQLETSLPEIEPNTEWDKEYNKLVPTDFYYRNVEGITAEQAFHMFLFQFFAKNEEWMIENGILVDGELRVYVTGKIETLIDNWGCII